MSRLRDDEIRRLLRYLHQQVEDQEYLAKIEDELRGADAEEFLREPELLAYFPEQTEELIAAGAKWILRIIPHAYLRMVQRGIQQTAVVSMFKLFVEKCAAEEQVITVGPYTIFGRPMTRAKTLTLRVDVDVVADTSGQARLVTVVIGRTNAEGTTERGLL
jgi:hypothetical protein